MILACGQMTAVVYLIVDVHNIRGRGWGERKGRGFCFYHSSEYQTVIKVDREVNITRGDPAPRTSTQCHLRKPSNKE